jgi:hypothetical protein
MANLEDLNKRLYKPGANFDDRIHEPGLTHPTKIQKPLWAEDAPEFLPPKHNWKLIIAASVFMAILVGGLLFVLLAPDSLFQSFKVEIEIIGEREIQSGDKVSWTVVVANNNSYVLDDVALTFNYPDGATSVTDTHVPLMRTKVNLGSMQKSERREQRFDAFVYGGRGATHNVSAAIEARQSGSNFVQGQTTRFSLTIVRSPISLSFEVPDELRAGQNMTIGARFVSQSERPISDLGLLVQLPPGFEFASANPAPTKKVADDKLFWQIDPMQPAEARLIEIRGVIKGSSVDTKSFQGTIGIARGGREIAEVYDAVAKVVNLRSSYLSISMRAPEVVTPGRSATVEVYWRNNLPVEIRNPIIEITPAGADYNLFGLSPGGGGSFQGDHMIWNSAVYPALGLVKPGGGGVITFSFRSKDNLVRSSDSRRPLMTFNAVFRASGPVDTFEGVDISGSDSLDVKVSTKFSFVEKGLYYNAPIFNSGPIPPRVGAETTYTVVWSFANSTNDVDGVVVRTKIPPYVVFKNIINPPNAAITYNELTGTVEWKVGRVSAGTGFNSPALQAAFQVGYTPLLVQLGSTPDLTLGTTASGRDTYSNYRFSFSSQAISTRLSDDPAITSSKQGEVVQ